MIRPRSSAHSTLFVAALATLAACGGTTEVKPPEKDVVPASITPLSTDTLRGVVGGTASLPLRVIVKNAAGEPLDTIPVTYAVTSGGGTISPTTIRTDATGEASATWTLGSTVGLQTATATVGNLTPVTFRAIASVGNATSMTKVAGDNQAAQINTNVPIPPSVKLTDQFGNPVPGVTVGFVVTAGGGTINGGAVNTDENGIATVTSWRLGSSIGVNTVVASTGSLSVTFTATATVGAAASVTLTPTSIPEMTVGATQQLTVVAKDAAGNTIPNPAVTYGSSAPDVASVSATGLIRAEGAGLATITATVGSASASVSLSVIGHPATISPSDTINLGVAPGDIAFTRDRMFISVNGTQTIRVYDATGKNRLDDITVLSPIPVLLAPSKAAGPLIAINPGTTSRVWFIDPGAGAVYDSLDVQDMVVSSAITSDGSKLFVMQSNGQLVAVDLATRAATPIGLGGGVVRIAIAPGDSLLYALTTVGVIFEVDARTNSVRRQIIANPTNDGFVIGRDGLFYLLDGTNSLVRIYDVNTGMVVRSVGVSASGTSLALSPDGQQIWITHAVPSQISILAGSVEQGFRSVGAFSTGVTLPIRVFFSPSGSFAAITNFGGFIQFVR